MCDAKLEENADFLEGREALQGYLDRCECWSITNRMKFNEHKCQILLLGQRNPGCTCRLGDEVGMQPCRSGGFWLMSQIQHEPKTRPGGEKGTNCTLTTLQAT